MNNAIDKAKKAKIKTSSEYTHDEINTLIGNLPRNDHSEYFKNLATIIERDGGAVLRDPTTKEPISTTGPTTHEQRFEAYLRFT